MDQLGVGHQTGYNQVHVNTGKAMVLLDRRTGAVWGSEGTDKSQSEAYVCLVGRGMGEGSYRRST